MSDAGVNKELLIERFKQINGDGENRQKGFAPWFWLKFCLRNPRKAYPALVGVWKEWVEPEQWIVLPEINKEETEVVRESSWLDPSTERVAMHRAQMENFQFILCTEGKRRGTFIENPKWQPLPQL
ncbi:MAG: hypothetical protein FWF12_00175 [Betaproteobacteria bacterium]|nr:hypothetical protein [Betaproteobacteria bacterium]